MHPPLPSSSPLAPSRARRRLEQVLTALFCLLLALPLVQQLTGVPDDIHLSGVEFKTPNPVLTQTSWFDGSFAATTEKWLLERLGLRGLLVHLACQANYSLFGRIGMSGGTEVVEGRDHWLFERAYIKWAMRPQDYSKKKAAQFAKRAARVQHTLAARGIAFAVVLAPNKAEIVPEKLPPDITLPPRNPAGFYDRLAAEMGKKRVNLLDGHRFFLDLKKREDYLFPPGGTHWSTYSAWLVWQELADRLRTQPACKDLPRQTVREIAWHPPLAADADLRMLLNLWRFEPDGPPLLPYPIVDPPPESERNRYSALVVGDSFALTLIDAMCRSGAFRQIDLLYYFNRRTTYPAPSFTQTRNRLVADAGIEMGPLDKNHRDWAPLIQNCQMVILTLNVIHIKEGGWGFLEALLDELRAMKFAADRETSRQQP